MFDWVLNTPMQSDILLNMYKDNVSSLQSTRCNKALNRIRSSVQWSRVQASRLASRVQLFRYVRTSYSVKIKLEIQKKPGTEPRKKADRRLACISNIYWIEKVLGYRDVIEISKFQQIGVDNRKTETNHNDEAPMFDEEREDWEIREKKIRIMSISSRPILPGSPIFSCANLSSCVSFFSPCLIQQVGTSRLSF